jgi:hypothetical protein
MRDRGRKDGRGGKGIPSEIMLRKEDAIEAQVFFVLDLFQHLPIVVAG